MDISSRSYQLRYALRAALRDSPLRSTKEMKLKLLSLIAFSTALACAEPASKNLRDTFFFRSIGSFSTATYFVEARIFVEEKNEFEKRFLNASNLRNAIIEEHNFTDGNEPDPQSWTGCYR